MLRRGFGVKHIGKLRLKGLQTMHLLVELAVREGRLVEDVVLVVRLLQFLTEALQLLALGCFYFRK